MTIDLGHIFETKTEAVNDRIVGIVEPNYHIFTPMVNGNFEKQWQNCFEQFQHYLKDQSNQKAFIVRVFIDAETKVEYHQRANQIKDMFFGTELPVNIISQSPENPNLVSIESGFVEVGKVDVVYGQTGNVRYCKLSVDKYAEFWIAGVKGNSETNDISDSSSDAFDQLHEAFKQLGIGFNQVVRQWNYVQQIFEFKQVENKMQQNYQLFNEVRSDYYSKYRMISDFPAATGIGVVHNGVSIDCLAVCGDENLRIVPICNPKQLNSYKYGQGVLKGEPAKSKTTMQAPQFERATLMTDGRSSRVFISGTASIIGEETIGINNIKEQTLVTIDNIELLTSKKNLRSHCPDLNIFPEKYAYLRVYVKNSEDIPVVKNICLNHFGKVPMSFVKADICRSNLLVEIEAEKVS